MDNKINNDCLEKDSKGCLTPVKGKRGRPRKEVIEAAKTRNKGVVGRPKGDNSRIQEFKARLMGTAGDKIMTTLINKALDDEDPQQMAALKMCVERLLPMSAFEAKKNSNAMPTISINISGMNEPEIIGEVVEADDVTFTDYEEGEE